MTEADTRRGQTQRQAPNERGGLAGISIPLPHLPDLNDLTAFQNLQSQQEKEAQKLKLSKIDFFRDAIRVRGSVLPRITPSVFGVTLWATGIFTADHFFGRRWNTSSAIVGPLSVVVGLLLVFRNSASYSRWDEARKVWATSTADAHTLARFIWVNVNPHADVKAEPPRKPSDEEVQRRVVKKKAAVRLLLLFFCSLAHELRDEEGINWPDYDQTVLPEHIREIWTVGSGALAPQPNGANASRLGGSSASGYVSYDSSTLRSLPPEAINTLRGQGPKPSRGSQQDIEADGRPSAAVESTPLLGPTAQDQADTDRLKASIWRASQHLSQSPPAMGLALFSLHELARYLAAAGRAGMLDDVGAAGLNAANQLLGNLTTAHSSLRRIREASIPVAYGIHLKQCTLFYLLALPLTLVTELGWKMVPFVTLVAVTLLGVVGISTELEVPYGDDASDHNLALFCAQFKHEVEHMLATIPDGSESDELCC
ncbi:unnamed protein product [Parajaminaea phylloscopi]